MAPATSTDTPRALADASLPDRPGLRRGRPFSGGVEAADALAKVLTSTLFLGTAVALLSWPIRSIAPSTGPDPSWLAGLYMAAEHGLRFGQQFVFTYGPLGFLQEPVLYDSQLWILAFLFQAFVHVALAVSLLWAARRALPLVAALGLTYALMVAGHLESGAVLLAFIWCFAALGERPPRFAVPLVVYDGGALAALELLGKANYGIAVFAFCLVTLLGLPGRRRNLPTFTAVAGGLLALLWALSGQGIGNVVDFISNTEQVIAGYSRAMSTQTVSLAWELPAALATGSLVIAAAVVASWRQIAPRRAAAVALAALFAFLSFKQGFVRQGLSNTPDFFATMLGGGIAVAGCMGKRPLRLPPRIVAVALLAPLLIFDLKAVPAPSLWEALKPADHADHLRAELDAFASASQRIRLAGTARRSMRSTYRVDRRTLRLLGYQPVHIDPWEIGVAWAYDLNWDPLPVIQSYSAYTPALDSLNAAALSGPDGPRAILRQNTAGIPGAMPSIDFRYPGWDASAEKLAMLCHYRSVRTTRRWQLLERSHNRCSPGRFIGRVETTTGEPIQIPALPSPRAMLIAKVEGVGSDGSERLRSLFYRARFRTATLNGHRTVRLVGETAADGLILSMPPLFDYPGPFRIAPDPRTVSFQIDGTGQRNIRVDFIVRLLNAPGSSCEAQPAPACRR